MEKQLVKVFDVTVEDASVKMELLNKDETEVLELTLFRQQYNDGKWEDNDEVSEKFYTVLQDVFGVFDLDDIENVIDKELELFVDEEKGKAFIEEPKSLNITKPTLEQVGDLESGVIADVVDFDTKRIIIVEVDGVRYPVNFGFGKWHAKLEKYLISKVDEIKKHKKFKDLTGRDWNDFEDIIGKNVMIEFKSFKTKTSELAFVEMKKLKK